MAPASTSDVPDNNLQLGLVKHIQNLRKEYNLILRRKKSLARKRQKLRSSKSSVAARIDLFNKLSNELSLGQLSLVCTSGSMEVDDADPLCSSAKRRRGVADGQLHIQESIRGLVEQENESVGLNEVEPRPSMNGKETKEPRYLLVSNGYAICCLDLMRSKGDSLIKKARDVPPLPKIATLKLLDKGLPVSVGLFKLGSDVYMIGGQEFPKNQVPDPDPFSVEIWGKNPKGYNLYRALSQEYDVQGTSHLTFRLSLADNDGTLSYAKCGDIGKLKKPKFWPIVEKVKGQIHVIDSVPEAFNEFDADLLRDWVFSHEALNCCSRRWIEIPTLDMLVYISSHLVVGGRIYAVGDGKLVVFDSDTNEWQARSGEGWKDAFAATKVWHVLECGIARCVGEYPLRIEGRAIDPPLYVLVALVRGADDAYTRTFALAYLVTSTGSVVCVQPLNHFYEKPVQPGFMATGTVIDVDEEGKTFCAIVTGSALFRGRKRDESRRYYFFINTFSVEMCTDAASEVLKIVEKGSEFWPVCLDFVRVDVKQRYVYEADAKLKKKGDLPGFPGVQACFM